MREYQPVASRLPGWSHKADDTGHIPAAQRNGSLRNEDTRREERSWVADKYRLNKDNCVG